MKIVNCGQAKPGQSFFKAYFVPAHQVIELEHFRHEEAEPYRRRIPIVAALWFD